LNAAGRVGRFDFRHQLNGLIDNYLYYSGRLDTALPFDELRRRSQINHAAEAADDASDFSERISSLLKNEESAAFSLFLPSLVWGLWCCERTLAYAASSLGIRIKL
jgi:hypothetical protein